MNDRVEASGPSWGAPSAKNHNAQRRPIVLVVGPPRSGMSLCAHILSAMGIDMADEVSERGLKARNQWEHWEIVDFHDRILKLFNRAYFGPFHDLSLPAAWWADPRVSHIRREIVGFLKERMDDSYFGLKDPRTVRLMPVWYHILNDLKLALKVVLCLRSPSQVAAALKERDGLDFRIGEYRWLIYMIDFYRYCNDCDVCVIDYERWFDAPLNNFEKLRKFLNLRCQLNEFDIKLMLSDIIDSELNESDSTHRKTTQSTVYSVYEAARYAGQDDARREQISDIVSRFINFQELQRPSLQAFEDLAEVATKLPEIENEAASLRAAIGERDQIIEAANARASAAEARSAEALQRLEAEAQQQAAFREAMQAEIAGLQRELVVTREVGKAVFAALRTAPELVQKPLSRRGWWVPFRTFAWPSIATRC